MKIMKFNSNNCAKNQKAYTKKTVQTAQKISISKTQPISFGGLEALSNYNYLFKDTTVLKEDKSAYKIITGLKLYNENNPNNDAARARMFTVNHELPEDWLKAYEVDYEEDFDMNFQDTRKTYGETFKTLREYAEYKSDPVRARIIQLKKIKNIAPAVEEHFLYRGLGPATPKEIIVLLETANKGDIIVPDWGVSCATPNPDYAIKHYTDGCLLRIKTPVGAQLAGLYKDGFAEFHMPSMSEYKYLGSCKIDNITVHDLEYIMPN